MRRRNLTKYRIFILLPIIAVISQTVMAEMLYVDGVRGNDNDQGTKEKPLSTIGKAAILVNNNTDSGPTIIKILPGIYNLTETVIISNSRAYTDKNRLTIEATVLPDDPGWKPRLMPVIFSTEDVRDPEKPHLITGTYGFKIKISHVTIRGLKFFGSPVPNNMYAPIERVDRGLEDLRVTQCMFVGDKDTFNIYCPAIATGNKFVVDHCIFHKCYASAVFWDGPESIGGKDNVMRYCIVDGGIFSGVWTCQTSDDFEFHNNIVTDTEYFWMRKKIERPKRYKVNNCIVNVKKFSGYGVESGPLGETGAEVTYDRTNVNEGNRITFVTDSNRRDYLHVVPGTFGSDLDAGLFSR